MDSHSFIVRVLRILMPIGALALLAVIFFVDWNNDAVVTEQFDKDDRSFSGLDVSVENPNISTLTAQGDEIEVTAENVARQSDEDETVFATEVQGEMDVGGSQWSIQSDEGEGEPSSSLARFRGHVVALIDGEYDLRGEEMIADVENRKLSAPVPIDVQSRSFDLSADEGVMTGERGSRVVKLKGNVKGQLRLQDRQDGEASLNASNDEAEDEG